MTTRSTVATPEQRAMIRRCVDAKGTKWLSMAAVVSSATVRKAAAGDPVLAVALAAILSAARGDA